MKLALSLGACLLLLATSSGCCCLKKHCYPGDPCGELVGPGCYLKWLFKHHCHKCCGYPAGCCPTPDCYAMPGCGAPMVYGDCGAPIAAGADCGCAAPSAAPMPMAPSASPPPRTSLPNVVPPPMTDPPPSPLPGTTADPIGVPNLPGADVPAPPPTTNWKPNQKKTPQLVSYEEFQRLPGQVISTTTSPAHQQAPSVSPGALPQVTPAASSAPASTWTPSRSH